MSSLRFTFALLFAVLMVDSTQAAGSLRLSREQYLDRVQAGWTAQIIACLMGFQFEHKVAATEWVTNYPAKVEQALVDDDWYYEMCALRAFEQHGIKMTVEQLGTQWLENACGSWGSSEEARLNLSKGINAPDCGHPRYNKLWFSIGPQFSAEIYGLLAPGMPNVAGELARKLGHINGYAEGVDGAVFMAGMVSLAFDETDPRVIVQKAARLIHPDSPYRQCLDEVIAKAKAGRPPGEIANAVEDRWRIEYPASNNAVPNGAIVAIGLWFGEGDFLRTMNLIYRGGDFTDADCNAANAGAVIGAMTGMKALPAYLVEPLNDRIVGDRMGPVNLTPAVDEKISDLAKRTVAIGETLVAREGGTIAEGKLNIRRQEPKTQPAESFQLADLMQYWNKDWRLERAGHGGAGGGIGGIGGITHLDGEVLATWPRDPVRGVVLRREVSLSATPRLSFEVGADPGRAWRLEVYGGNKRLLQRTVEGKEGPGERTWQKIQVDLSEFAGRQLQLRLYQRVLLPDKLAGNAYWRSLELK